MLKVDWHLIPQHNIDDRNQLSINRDGHIGNFQRSFRIVQFGFRYSRSKHTVAVLFILVRGSIGTLWCSIGTLRWWWSLTDRFGIGAPQVPQNLTPSATWPLQ